MRAATSAKKTCARKIKVLTSLRIVFISPICCAPFSIDHKSEISTASCGHNQLKLKRSNTTYGYKESWSEEGWSEEEWRREKGRREKGRRQEALRVVRPGKVAEQQPPLAHTTLCGLHRPFKSDGEAHRARRPISFYSR